MKSTGNIYTICKNGDFKTRLSFLIMGAGNLLRRAQQKFGAPARYRPPEMVLKEKGEATGRLASQSAGQAPSINQEMRARRRVEEKVQTQELSNAEITRIVDRVYRKLESRIATEYRRRGM